MNSRGPGLLERLIGYGLVLTVVCVLVSETARLVRVYAGWIILSVVVTVVLAIGMRIWSGRRW